jgi:uncharacterized repeat protein (TIGR03803 family)
MRVLSASLLLLPVFGAKAAVVFTTLHFFTGTNDGAQPVAGLVQGSDGYFYGTTSSGGTNGLGTVFKISAAEGYTSLYSFSGTNDGANPLAALVQGSNGYFYGTTENGGRHGDGTVFQISTNGALATLYSFTGGNDGAWPYGGLVQGSDGYFYGTTDGGGTTNLNVYGSYGYGTVFKINTNGVLASLYTFGNVYEDGANSQAGLVQGSDGYFYGTTSLGGMTNFGGSGTVFQISTNGALATLYSFTGGNDGAWPYGGLVQGSDGYLYGTTEGGGEGGSGTVFRLTILSEFQAVTLTNSTLSLTWSTEAGSTYQLQFNSDLSSSNWINLSSPATAIAATLTTTDFITNAPQRFYRLVLSP